MGEVGMNSCAVVTAGSGTVGAVRLADVGMSPLISYTIGSVVYAGAGVS